MRAALFIAATLSIAVPAFAQDTTEVAATRPAVPAISTWDEDIRAVFIGEGDSAMRAEDQARQRWSALPPDRQAQVRRDCEATRAGAVEGATPAPDAVDPPTETTGSIRQPGVLSLSELVQICDLVDRL